VAREISMGDDGILRVAVVGTASDEEAEAFLRDFTQIVESATETEPLHLIVDTTLAGKPSAVERRAYFEINRNPRIGKAAVLGASRYTRVVISFVLKTSGRDNVRFFDLEEEALTWLKEGV
jgi:hypothetical protein